MADESRPFVIEVKRRWLLWILPILATIYFVTVVTVNLLDLEIQGVSTEMLVYGGLGLFLVTMLVEIPFFFRRSGPRPPRAARAQPDVQATQTMGAAPAGALDDEYLITDEQQQGLQVLEYSAPAKSRNSNAVYTKTYVPVSQAHVVRVETAVADATEI